MSVRRYDKISIIFTFFRPMTSHSTGLLSSDWMKKFGKPDETNLDKAEDIYDADIQSLAIMIEQLRRYGGIKYKREGRVNEKNLPKP